MGGLCQQTSTTLRNTFHETDWTAVSSSFVRLCEESYIAVVETISETLFSWSDLIPNSYQDAW